MAINLVDPIFLRPVRQPRSYRGGSQLDRFLGEAGEGDGDRPEAALAATTPAGDVDVENDDTLTRVLSEDGRTGPALLELLEDTGEVVLGQEHLSRYGANLGVNCRLLDPSEPLAVQYRPLNGEVPTDIMGQPILPGEAWYVLSTREIDGRPPCIYAGLRPGVSVEQFADAAGKGDDAMRGLMHGIEVRPGSAFYLPAGLPYAVGAGVLLYKSEPLHGEVIQAARVAGEGALPGLTAEATEQDELLSTIRVEEHILRRSDEGFWAELVGPQRTGGFALWRVEAVGRLQVQLPSDFAVALCIGGDGRIGWAGGMRELNSGECFLQPHSLGWIEYIAHGRLSVLLAMPGK